MLFQPYTLIIKVKIKFNKIIITYLDKFHKSFHKLIVTLNLSQLLFSDLFLGTKIN